MRPPCLRGQGWDGAPWSLLREARRPVPALAPAESECTWERCRIRPPPRAWCLPAPSPGPCGGRSRLAPHQPPPRGCWGARTQTGRILPPSQEPRPLGKSPTLRGPVPSPPAGGSPSPPCTPLPRPGSTHSCTLPLGCLQERASRPRSQSGPSLPMRPGTAPQGPRAGRGRRVPARASPAPGGAWASAAHQPVTALVFPDHDCPGQSGDAGQVVSSRARAQARGMWCTVSLSHGRPGSERMAVAAGMEATEASPACALPPASLPPCGQAGTGCALPPAVRRREPPARGALSLAAARGRAASASLPPAMPVPASCRGRKVSAGSRAAVWHGPGLGAPATVSQSPGAMHGRCPPAQEQ